MSEPTGKIFGVTSPSPGSVAYGHPRLTRLPSAYDAPENTDKLYPCVIFLHGDGQAGNGSYDPAQVDPNGNPVYSETNQLANLLGGGPPAILASNSGLFDEVIFIAPQNVVGGNWNNTVSLGNNLTCWTNKYRIDPDRIYVLGISRGGQIWNFGRTHGDKMAVLVACCGAINPVITDDLSKLSLPIVIGVHGTNDPSVDVRWTFGGTQASPFLGWLPAIVKNPLLDTHPEKPTLVKTGGRTMELAGVGKSLWASYNPESGWVWSGTPVAGGKTYGLLVPGVGHGCWDSIFGTAKTPNLDFWRWLLSQKRGQVSTQYGLPPPPPVPILTIITTTVYADGRCVTVTKPPVL